jgi:photosynthetic reaction center H subunit
MGTGAITSYFDVAQLVLYMFWAFFAGLIYYLVRENHREGYPMDHDGKNLITGWPVPRPKTYLLANGEEVSFPNGWMEKRPLMAERTHRLAGGPIAPIGDPMLAGVGPGSWVERADRPDTNSEGEPKLSPLRISPEFGVVPGDTDPRGLDVVGADGEVGGKVVDLWLDTAENLFRYFELKLAGSERQVLLPINFAKVHRDRIVVKAILGGQFKGVPGTRQADVVTLLEEEKIQAYYGAGMLYAEPSRAEPLV